VIRSARGTYSISCTLHALVLSDRHTLPTTKQYPNNSTPYTHFPNSCNIDKVIYMPCYKHKVVQIHVVPLSTNKKDFVLLSIHFQFHLLPLPFPLPLTTILILLLLLLLHTTQRNPNNQRITPEPSLVCLHTRTYTRPVPRKKRRLMQNNYRPSKRGYVSSKAPPKKKARFDKTHTHTHTRAHVFLFPRLPIRKQYPTKNNTSPFPPSLPAPPSHSTLTHKTDQGTTSPHYSPSASPCA